MSNRMYQSVHRCLRIQELNLQNGETVAYVAVIPRPQCLLFQHGAARSGRDRDCNDQGMQPAYVLCPLYV